MKKTILTILCSLFTICGMAQSEKTYTDQLVITINGKSEEPQTTTVTVIDNGNGTVNFEMKNFFMISGEDAIPVGNIFIENLLVSEGDDGLKHITYDAPLVIQPGDMEGVDMWYGPMFGEIPLKLKGKMTDEKFYAVIDIDLSYLSYVIVVLVACLRMIAPNTLS